MLIGITKEKLINESRVAATPQTVSKLINLGFSVKIENDAGKNANFDNQSYIDAGAEITSTQEIWQLDIILKINAPDDKEISLLKEGSILISFIWPAKNQLLVNQLAKKKITVIAMDSIPRISRAQSLDALSSMANIAGYRAVVEAAYAFDRFFGGQITAAGKLLPAKVLVIGAGVSGLSAISAAKNMGAIVRAFDTRSEVKEQIQSLGAEFLQLDYEETINSNDGYASVMSKDFIKAEMKLFNHQTKEADIVITTALIPGKEAPKLITEQMVQGMKYGSVIVDLAIQSGGNCSLTIPDKIITTNNGVKIIGYTDLASRLPTQSSQLYANNILNLIKLISKGKQGKIELDFNDVVVRHITIIDKGNIIWPAPPIKISIGPEIKSPESQEEKLKKQQKTKKNQDYYNYKYIFAIMMSVVFVCLSNKASSDLLSHVTIFILSCIVGYYIVWNVNHALHTPLMSVTNAISGIIIIGAILQIGDSNITNYIAFIAILISSINIFGGFNVTNRMLKMFRKG
ncbi:Re/Si-specific NAD(P)(+) transhydrogenase subunit alpha [Candidatus Pantoea edessiphila]|uniref:NAD(P) transhydrogenase subunit alpha n=1 Tax=Candidatus Pantoea edessiphila TaxID=2044610 RepID=A0A2P5SWU2_9GAMM|nr:Re/Si-specific NAD(P)(+) transhydrogenase subunit alpha [Candidatus Pantoea edessiphila]PPI86791.1 NAD(P)(+) transhydrogenase (Re/Si-specific) subunit alpha [Candidatus Pantoea edessiphila]